MTNNEANILKISRLLTPEHRGNLLAFVHLSYAAETYIRKSSGSNYSQNETFSRKTQEYSCRNNVQRSKK
jgi:hypothetical protein